MPSRMNRARPTLPNEQALRPPPRTLAASILVLIAVTLVAFAGVLDNGFVNWDDDHLLTANDRFRGLSGDSFRWSFTTTQGGHYQPLTWLSYAIDFAIWRGLNAAGFHLTNLVLHVATAIGFYFVARRLVAAALPDTSREGVAIRCALAAIFFAVHPLRVESVAWATERRDVLSGAFLMLTSALYLRAASSTDRRRRFLMAGALLAYAASLLSKAAGITLPIVLLLMDVYPLRRIGSRAGRSDWPAWRVLGEKCVFAVLALSAASIALAAQARSGALRGFDEHPLGLRIGQAAYGILFYIAKMVWPSNLLPLYEQDPQATAWDPRYLASIAALCGITAVFLLLRKRCPALFFTWLAYLTLLLPVMGLAQSGPQLVADRYTYLASMPWAVLLGGGVAKVWATAASPRWRVRVPAAFAMVLILAAYVTMTRAQTEVWRDSFTLWSTITERAPQTGMAHANLAALLNSTGDAAGARDHALRALDRLPGNRLAHNVLGRSSLALGDAESAEHHLRIALQIATDVGKTDPETMVVLAATLTQRGRDEEAEAVYREVLQLEPDAAEWRFAFGGFLASRERFEEAASAFARAVELAPTRTDSWFRLGVVRSKMGDFGGAREAFEGGLSRNPADVALRAELAWLLATCVEATQRDGRRAVELASSALADSGGASVRAGEALAAAEAEMGEFEAAIAIVEGILSSHPDLAESTRARLAAALDKYQAERPLRH